MRPSTDDLIHPQSVPSELEQRGRLTCFDWDDTLFATSATVADPFFKTLWTLEELRSAVDTDHEHWWSSRFQALQADLLDLLSATGTTSDLIILTNAERMWFQTCMTLLPAVHDWLQLHQVTVLFAREDFEARASDFICCYCIWKKQALDRYLKRAPHTWTEILLLGDGDADEHLADSVIRRELFWRCIFVRFQARPTLPALLIQLQYVRNNSFDYPDRYPRIILAAGV